MKVNSQPNHPAIVEGTGGGNGAGVEVVVYEGEVAVAVRLRASDGARPDKEGVMVGETRTVPSFSAGESHPDAAPLLIQGTTGDESKGNHRKRAGPECDDGLRRFVEEIPRSEESCELQLHADHGTVTTTAVDRILGYFVYYIVYCIFNVFSLICNKLYTLDIGTVLFNTLHCNCSRQLSTVLTVNR